MLAGYDGQRIAIDTLGTEGAAGSLYCTVEARLFDTGPNPRAPRSGTITLRRANDVPGASERELRWTVRSSEFEEPMERAGRGEPA
ncbi:hypothetical protein EG799_08370 [Aurantiacibacter spongiae]|uniref:Uncharacterized protein n=2 Tax=Aurantiacibacter spongiae TaxID=2488860 RepID=A0A3N5CRC6_9SPHN|nr:hypothetical protein EG799_08370 [Aurantiacibacter spongiae]